MAKKMFDFNKNYKKFLIGYLAIFVVGIVIAAIWGVDLDINFKGGTRISYSYSGDITEKDIRATVDEAIEEKFEVSKSTSIASGAAAARHSASTSTSARPVL